MEAAKEQRGTQRVSGKGLVCRRLLHEPIAQKVEEEVLVKVLDPRLHAHLGAVPLPRVRHVHGQDVHVRRARVGRQPQLACVQLRGRHAHDAGSGRFGAPMMGVRGDCARSYDWPTDRPTRLTLASAAAPPEGSALNVAFGVVCVWTRARLELFDDRVVVPLDLPLVHARLSDGRVPQVGPRVAQHERQRQADWRRVELGGAGRRNWVDAGRKEA
eukprot:2020610-Prymnesium_polylepis.1